MVDTMVSICAATGERKYFSEWEATLEMAPENPRSPTSSRMARGRGAFRCDECGYWHRAVTPDRRR